MDDCLSNLQLDWIEDYAHTMATRQKEALAMNVPSCDFWFNGGRVLAMLDLLEMFGHAHTATKLKQAIDHWPGTAVSPAAPEADTSAPEVAIGRTK